MNNNRKVNLLYVFILVACTVFNSVNAADSKPYFQQEVNYTIKVTLNDVLHSLDGSISFEYINNSPDTLHEIYIHLWPNAYKNKETPLVKEQLEEGKTDLYFAKDEERGFIESLNFFSNNSPLKFEYKAVDYGRIILDQPLLPGAHQTFFTAFYVKIPEARFSRMGHVGQAYYITQWYPKPAVYDREGWHPMSYLDKGEFYSEFGKFEVAITLPANYIVCATGALQDKDEASWLNLKAGEDHESIPVLKNDFPPSEKKTKTLTYIQDNVHDFAWFADKRYLVKKSTVQLPNTGRRVDTWAFFTPLSAKLFKNATTYINETIYNYSVYNGDYIYNSCSVAEGVFAISNGMEYPMVTLISAEDTFNLEVSIVHEVGHNWFYGMLASNERDHPWMDEGLNSLNELRWIMQKYSGNNVKSVNFTGNGRFITKLFGLDKMHYKDLWQLEFNTIASVSADQPANLPAEEYSWLSYGSCVYRKAGLAFDYLRSYLGDELFDRCMRKYFDQWRMKHPSPADLKKIFVTETGKDLNWFFEGILSETGATDYKIKCIKQDGEKSILSIGNKGTVDGPFRVNGLKNDSTIISVLSEGFKDTKDVTINCPECTSYHIDYFRNTIDLNRNNNNIKTNGLFRKSDPLTISMFPKLYPGNGHHIYILPSAAWNEYNKWMAGITFYNKIVPVKSFEYGITALYGFGDNEPAGLGSFNYNFYPRKGFLDYAGIGLKGKRFAFDKSAVRKSFTDFEEVHLHYLRLEPYLELQLRKPNSRSTVRNSFYFSLVDVTEDDVVLKQRVPAEGYNITGVESNHRQVFRGKFYHNNFRGIDPYSLTLGIEANESYQKYSLTAEYFFKYAVKGKGVKVRYFAGVESYKTGEIAYPFYLSSWSGSKDFWYDELYFGRSESDGMLSQQMSLADGGFKTGLAYALSAKWLTAINIHIDLPGVLPISVFFDAGTYSDAKKSLAEDYKVSNSIIYDGGICLASGFVKIYFPVIRSADIKASQDGTAGIDKVPFKKQIRFEINLDRLNPLYLRKQFLR